METIERIPEQSIVLVEEESGCMKDFFAHKVAVTTAGEGKTVTYLTTHYRDDIAHGLQRYAFTLPPKLSIAERVQPGENIAEKCSGDLCIIDPFSTLVLGRDSGELMHLMNGMKEQTRKGRSFLLVSDAGVLSPQQEHLVRALADGVIRFVAMAEGDKIKRYMYVLKMKGALPVDKMIPFTVTEEGLQIDTRERLG